MKKHCDLLNEALKTAFYHWDGDFKSVIVSLDGYYDPGEDISCFAVDVTHINMRVSVVFKARVTGNKVEIDFNEDDWVELTTKSIFQYMYFETAQPLSRLLGKQILYHDAVSTQMLSALKLVLDAIRNESRQQGKQVMHEAYLAAYEAVRIAEGGKP